MDKFKIITGSGIEKEVDGIFYLFNSKYFFTYTEKDLDENGYVIFHLVQVGKEIKNTPDGPIDTGYMVGMEISNDDEWKNVQSSVTKLVEDKKNNTNSEEIQYLPQNMLSVLRIISSKTFRLAQSVVKQVFKLSLNTEIETLSQELVNDNNEISSLVGSDNLENEANQMLTEQQMNFSVTDVANQALDVDQFNNTNFINDTIPNNLESVYSQPSIMQQNSTEPEQNDIIVDYRSRFFEEQEKNKQLEDEIKRLNEKIESIKMLIN